MDLISSAIVGIIGYFLISYIFDNNHEPLIIDKDHVSRIIITHITEDDDEIKNYVEKWLEYLFLNENNDIEEHELPFVPKQLLGDNIYIEYKLDNHNYIICVNGEIKKKPQNDSIVSKIQRKILTGYLESKDRDEKICVKKLLKEFQGPKYNFYSNLDGVSKKIKDVLYPYDLKEWDTLLIHDLFGEITKIDLNNVENNYEIKLS